MVTQLLYFFYINEDLNILESNRSDFGFELQLISFSKYSAFKNEMGVFRIKNYWYKKTNDLACRLGLQTRQ